MSNKQRANIRGPGPGRPKGSVNRTTAALKEAVLEAFDRGGGVAWLLALMQDEPRIFASLLLRLIPPTPPEDRSDDDDGDIFIDPDPDL